MRYILLLCFLVLSCASQPAALFQIKSKLVTVTPGVNGIDIRFDTTKSYSRIVMLRSHYNFIPIDTINTYSYPISEIDLSPSQTSFTDSLIAPNHPYHYLFVFYTKDGKILQSKPQIATYIKKTELPQKFKKLNILIDKNNYILELRDSATVITRYPVSLGQDPFNRKIERDNLSTPEGIYHCNYLKPKSQFYKAIGVNYPNSTDQKRFTKAKEEKRLRNTPPNIGGAIQIHGGGLGHNWTFGCIAVANSTMDDLYKIKVKPYTPIFITGSEITRDSLPY